MYNLVGNFFFLFLFYSMRVRSSKKGLISYNLVKSKFKSSKEMSTFNVQYYLEKNYLQQKISVKFFFKKKKKQRRLFTVFLQILEAFELHFQMNILKIPFHLETKTS